MPHDYNETGETMRPTTGSEMWYCVLYTCMALNMVFCISVCVSLCYVPLRGMFTTEKSVLQELDSTRLPKLCYQIASVLEFKGKVTLMGKSLASQLVIGAIQYLQLQAQPLCWYIIQK